MKLFEFSPVLRGRAPEKEIGDGKYGDEKVERIAKSAVFSEAQ